MTIALGINIAKYKFDGVLLYGIMIRKQSSQRT